MKHLTTLITTLLLSIIASPMSADTGGTYQLVPKDYTFQVGDIIIIASYDSNKDLQLMRYDTETNKFLVYKKSLEVKVINSTTPYQWPDILTISDVNTNSTPIELYIASNASNIITLKKHNNEGLYLAESSKELIFSADPFQWNTRFEGNNNETGSICLANTETTASNIRAFANGVDGFKIANGSLNLTCCYKKVIPPATVSYSISSYGYSTLYYSNKSLILPEGVKAYTYTIDNGNLKVLETFDGSSKNEEDRIVPRGAAVMVKGAPGNYELVETTAEPYNNANNMLAGTDEEEVTTDGSEYYMLSVGKIGLGFYWGADDGAAFTNGAHKAYLRIPSGSPAKTMHFSLPDDTPTAINTTTATKPALHTTYDIQGINASHSGIVISNGKKFIRK